MIHLQSCGFFGAMLCFIPAVLALQNGGDYSCNISNTGKLTVRFRIDRSKYPSRCVTGDIGKPFFDSSPDGTVPYATRCTVPYDIKTSGNCNVAPGTAGCHCTSETDSSYYVIEYNADSGYETYWEASINCADANFIQLLSFTMTDCDDVQTPTTTSPTTVTTKSTTSGDEETPGLSQEEKIGIGLGVSFGAAIICGLVVGIYLHKKKKLPSGGTCEIQPTVTRSDNGTSGGNKPTGPDSNDGTSGGNKPIGPDSNDGNTGRSKPPTNNGSSDGHSAEADGSSVSKPRDRDLPLPKTTGEKRAGQEATSFIVNETHTAAESASSVKESRKLPLPNTGQASTTPRLPPLNNQAPNSMTSVERNSYVEPTKPRLPPISSK